MTITTTVVGNVEFFITLSPVERADLAKLFYNLKDGVDPHTNMDVEQVSRVNNMFSPLYDAFDTE